MMFWSLSDISKRVCHNDFNIFNINNMTSHEQRDIIAWMLSKFNGDKPCNQILRCKSQKCIYNHFPSGGILYRNKIYSEDYIYKMNELERQNLICNLHEEMCRIPIGLFKHKHSNMNTKYDNRRSQDYNDRKDSLTRYDKKRDRSPKYDKKRDRSPDDQRDRELQRYDDQGDRSPDDHRRDSDDNRPDNSPKRQCNRPNELEDGEICIDKKLPIRSDVINPKVQQLPSYIELPALEHEKYMKHWEMASLLNKFVVVHDGYMTMYNEKSCRLMLFKPSHSSRICDAGGRSIKRENVGTIACKHDVFKMCSNPICIYQHKMPLSQCVIHNVNLQICASLHFRTTSIIYMDDRPQNPTFMTPPIYPLPPIFSRITASLPPSNQPTNQSIN